MAVEAAMVATEVVAMMITATVVAMAVEAAMAVVQPGVLAMTGPGMIMVAAQWNQVAMLAEVLDLMGADMVAADMEEAVATTSDIKQLWNLGWFVS